MSGAKEIRKTTRELRQAGIEVTEDGHPHVLDEQGQLVYVLPKTPGSQSSVRKSKIVAERIIRGEPVRAESGHHGRNAPGKVIRDLPQQAPPARPERRLKERFVPASQDVGPLGYSPEEIFQRMPVPAPAKPRREVVSMDDPVAFGRWYSANPRHQTCTACERNAVPDQLTVLRCRLSEHAFMRTCIDRLHMPTDQAEKMVEANLLADPDLEAGFTLMLCRSCLQRSGMLGGVPRENFLTMADVLANVAASAGTSSKARDTSKRILTLDDEPVPAAFQRSERPVVSPPPVVPFMVIRPQDKQQVRDALKDLTGDQENSQPHRGKAKRKRRR